MIDVFYYGDGKDSQRAIDAVSEVVDADVGYRFVPGSVRDDSRSVWGVRVDAASVDEAAITDALESEFGSVTHAETVTN